MLNNFTEREKILIRMALADRITYHQEPRLASGEVLAIHDMLAKELTSIMERIC